MSPGNHRVAVEARGADPRPSWSPPDRINVCHIVSGDLWAGAEVQVATLLRHLARDQGLALSAILLNPGRLADELTRSSIESLIIPESRTSFLGILRQAAGLLRGKNIHVLHSHRYKENLLATLLAWRLNIPVLVRTRHGLAEPQRGLKNLKQRFFQLMDKLTARWAADSVIGVSTELAHRLSRQFGPEKVTMIPNGVEIEQIRSALSVAEARERLSIPADCPVLGTAGRLEPVKRLDIFLEAARQISHRDPKTRFVIAGVGREQARLQTLAVELGLEGRVYFLGFRDDIFDVLRALDILVLSSDHEGLPMILLEALAMGLTVVARDVGGISEVIHHRVSGILVPSESPDALAGACLGALADEALRCRLGEAGRKMVTARFSAERSAGEVAMLYRSLVGPQ